MLERRMGWGWTLIVLAIVARAAAVLVLQSHTVPNSTYEHGTIAANLLAGRGFSTRFLGADGPTSQQAPVYPVIIAGAYALGGTGTPRALLILELGQAVLGGWLVAGVVRLSREIAPGRPLVAGAAGLIAAVHPSLVYAATHVQVALLAATLLSWTLALAYHVGRTGRGAIMTGLLLALLALTDPILGLAGVGVAWAIAAGQGMRGAVRPLALVGVTTLAMLMPWTIRNYRVHGEFVAVKSSFGYAFWQGNCKQSEGTDKVVRASVERVLGHEKGQFDLRKVNVSLWQARHEAGYLDDIVLTAGDYRELGSVAEPERSRRLFRRALADLRTEPGRYGRLCLRRLRYFLLFDETNPKTRSLIYRGSHVGLTVLAILGLIFAAPGTRRRLGPTIATAALIATFHILTIVSARFHIPIEPLMAVWAGCGLSRIGVRADPAMRTDRSHPARYHSSPPVTRSPILSLTRLEPSIGDRSE
jgi:hypothetical protein